MGKALFIWQQFMDDSHAPRRSSKTVKLFLDCLKPTDSLWLICMYIESTCVFLIQVERLTVLIRMETLRCMSLLDTAMNF